MYREYPSYSEQKTILTIKPRINVVFSLRCLFSEHLFLPLFTNPFIFSTKVCHLYIHMFALFSWILADIFQICCFVNRSGHIALFTWSIAPKIRDGWSENQGSLIPKSWIVDPKIKDCWSKKHGSLIWKSSITHPEIKDGWSKNHGSLIRISRSADPKVMDRWSENQGSLIPKIMDRWSKNHGSLIQKSWTADRKIKDRWPENQGLLIQKPRIADPKIKDRWSIDLKERWAQLCLFSLPTYMYSPLTPLPSHLIPFTSFLSVRSLLSSLSPLIMLPLHPYPRLPLLFISSTSPHPFPLNSVSLIPVSPFPSPRSLFSLIPLLSEPSLPSHPSPLSSFSPLCWKTIFIAKNKNHESKRFVLLQC